jgi:ABC-type transporter Mla subunit MlaD
MNLDDAASSLRANAADAPALLQALAARLADIPGVGLQVSRKRGRISRFFGDIPYLNDFHLKSAPVSAIRVQLGDRIFRIDANSSGPACFLGSANTQTGVAFPEWIAELIDELSEMRRASDETLRSLEQLVVRNDVDHH